MYDIYVGDTMEETLELLYSFTEKNHREFFNFIDSNNLKIGILNELRVYDETVNFSREEIKLIRKELDKINKITDMDFLISIIKACNKALDKKLELICSGE